MLVLAVAACSSDEPSRDAAGNIDESGAASVFSLQVGDCFNDEAGAGDVITDVPVVPCDEPHDNEVFFEFAMTDAVFPGNDAAIESGALRCLEQFQPFVGSDYLESELEIFPITPTAQSWEDGDRIVYCVLYALDLSKLEGSMRGSNR
jgi:hypothetical protein